MAGQVPVINGVIRLQGDTSSLPKMVDDARRSSDQIKRQFESDFSDVGRIVRDSLSVSRNSAGSLDLGVGQYQAAAKAAEAHAIAMREVANAARSAAVNNDDTTESTRRYVVAAQAAAREAEDQAREAQQTATAYSRLQAELDKTASATQAVVRASGVGTTANNALVNSTRAVRTASLQAGQQLQDVAISLYSGQRAGVVFAQQLPQLAFALSGLEGSANKTHQRIGRFATFLSGPWGLAVGLATGVLATYITKLIFTGDESEKTERAQRSLVEVLDDATSSYQEVAQAAQDYADKLAKSREVNIEAIATEATAIATRLQSALATRQQLQAELELRQERERSIARGARSDPGASGAIAGAAALTTLTANAIEENAQALKALEAAAGEVTIKTADAIAELNSDPTKNIREGFNVLRNEARETIKDVDALSARLTALNKQEKAALDAMKKTASGGGGSSNTSNARVGDMTALLKELFPGVRITSTTGGKHTKGSDHYAGRAIDFVPAGGMGQYSTAEVERILEDAGVKIRRGKSGTKQIFGPGRSAGKPGDHDDHFHVAWSGSVSPEKAAAAAERQAQATARLAEFGRDARVQIAAIGRSFADTPPAIEASQRELERLDDLAAAIMLKKPEGWQDMLVAIQALRPEAEALANGPFKDMLESAEEQARIEELLIAGKAQEAEIQRRIHMLVKDQGPLTTAQEQTIRAIVAQERIRGRLLEKQADARQRELDYLRETQDNISNTIYELLSGKGVGSIGNFFKRQFDSVIAQMAESITESLFGDMFRDRKDKILGFDKVKESSLATAKTANKAASALDDLAAAASGASTAMMGSAANDNDLKSLQAMFDEVINPGITVVGRKDSIGKTLKSELNGLGKEMFGEEAFGKLSKVFKKGMEGAAIGQVTSGIAKSLGLKQSSLGSQLGGAAGMAIGGPIGAAVGGLLGGTVGGLFKKSRSAGATITGPGAFTLGGKDRKNYDVAEGLAGSVISGLENIAQRLGGSVGSFRTTIGVRHGDYRVNESGNSLKIKKGAVEFDDDVEGAIAFAIADAVKDGAIKGISAAAQRLLQMGDDVEAQLQKALSFQSVFDRLKEIDDPVGYAVEQINREFESLIKIFNEAGASAEEYAELERLYGIERAQAVEEANDRVLGSLRSFYDQLTIGNDALSLRDRRSAAQAKFDPLKDRVLAGDTTAFDAYSEAATALLDIERQISGSQQGYFDLYNQVLGITKGAISSQEGLASSGSSLPNPFTSSPNNTAASVPVVGAINQMNSDILRALSAVNDNLGTVIRQGKLSGARGLTLGGGSW